MQGTPTSVLVIEKANGEECSAKSLEMSRQVLRAEDCRVLVRRSLCEAVEKPAGRVRREQCLLTALD